MLVSEPGDVLVTGIGELLDIAGLSVPVELRDIDPGVVGTELESID